ncbi:MAG: TonB-dependent receptor [Bacteroidales bacterium]|nr:TonB-dependent receptor [Bacteroidales bacterium]
MKNFIITLAIFSLCAFSLTAQHQLSGIVRNEADGSPIPYATAAMLRSDSSAVTGTITDTDGKFTIQNVASGNYILQVSFIGYERAFRNVRVPAQSALGDITLAESTNRLEEVVVSADRPLVVARTDRYVVNVSGNIQSAGRNATNILQNTPGVLVSQQGDISVLGNNVEVWIDGRPSQMSGEQLQAFLSSMQGDEIDRIEVITNPSSRYDAAGSGGIIDIRTKKGLQFGVNGTLTAGYRQGHVDRENTGVSLNWRREKFNVFGNYSVNRNNNWEKLTQTNVMKTSIGEVAFDQNTLLKSSNASFSNTVRAGVDYFINPKNTLGIIVNANYSDGLRDDVGGITNITPTYEGVTYSTADNFITSQRDGIQVNMNYQLTFDKPGQQLNFDLDYASFGSNSFQQNKNTYYSPGNVMLGDIEQLRNSNPQTIDVYSSKLDYVQPLWKGARMETGAKISQTQTDNDLKFDVFADNDWQVDANQTNRFIYKEQIDAGYISFSQQLGKFSLQAGLRGEHTWSEGKQMTTGEVNDTSYFNLFPTLFVNWQASEKHTLGLSYSRRLSRPGYGQLNPFEIAIDAYSFRAGNPNLMPAYTHNVQLSHTFAQGFMTRIGYSHTTDLIILTPVEDAATQRYGLVDKNFGKSQNINAMVNYRKQIAKVWTASLFVQGAYQIGTSNEASGRFVNEGGSLIVQLNNNLTITPTLSAEVTGMYMSGMRMGYFVLEPMGGLSAGLRQTLLKNKMTLSLNVSDILYTSNEKASAKYENVNNSIFIETDRRYVNLTLSYNFGSATVKAARSKSTGIEEEKNRAGGR